MKNRSMASNWGLIASIVTLLAFFLPWVRACGMDFSGYDLATNDLVDDNWLYWLSFCAPLVCVLLYFAAQPARAAIGRAIAAIVGMLPIVKLFETVISSNEEIALLSIRPGGVLTIVGYIGILISAIVDFPSPEK